MISARMAEPVRMSVLFYSDLDECVRDQCPNGGACKNVGIVLFRPRRVCQRSVPEWRSL